MKFLLTHHLQKKCKIILVMISKPNISFNNNSNLAKIKIHKNGVLIDEINEERNNIITQNNQIGSGKSIRINLNKGNNPLKNNELNQNDYEIGQIDEDND